jgi:plastocyanin domain-containing protein
MMTAKIIVTAAGLLLIGWVNWYFFLSRRRGLARKR